MACHIVKPGSEKIAAIEKVIYEYLILKISFCSIFQHSIHRWWRHYVIINSILDRRITPYLGDLCFRKYSSRRIDKLWKLPYTCIKGKGKWIIHFKIYVYVIICVQVKQNIVIKQVENSIFTFSYHHVLFLDYYTVRTKWLVE